MLEVVGNDDTGVSIVYTDSNGRPIQNQSLPGLTTVTISEVKPNIYVITIKRNITIKNDDND